MKSNLYIHIPFCSHICAYCDFTKIIYDEKMATQYIDTLIEEINSYSLSSLETIYLGGGTPSSLNYDLLEKLLKVISPLKSDKYEFTVECNFENLTKEKLELFKKYGVNRLSFGVQSMNNDVLKLLNRHHTKEDVIKTIKLAKDMGFHNITIDLIYGLPTVTNEMLQSDLEEFIKLDIEHISTYSLMVNPNTLFYVQGVKEVSDIKSRELYDIIYAYLKEHGYYRYEVSNFAKPGYESKHNSVYWDNKNYVGVGLGASGYIDNVRYQNTKSLSKYLKKEFISEKEIVTHKDNINYFLMLKLRKKEGFTFKELASICDEEEYQQIQKVISKFVNQKLLVTNHNSVYCSDDGMMLLDIILRDIFIE